jgi:hypothetical protein
MPLLLLVRRKEVGGVFTPPPIDPGDPGTSEPTPDVQFVPFGEYSDLERLFIAEQPKFLWPENQDSNFGILRKVLTDHPQLTVDQLNALYLEMFVLTSVAYLGRWEEQVGLPANPTASITLRRAMVLERLSKRLFTRTRRREIVERFLQNTLGEAVQLTPEGVALTPEGVPLYSGELESVLNLYFITEDIETFHYTVYIASTATPNEDSLIRELLFLTPAGISFEIVYFIPGTGRLFGDYNFGDFTFGGDEA